jgi:hypothetical protein
MAPLHRVNRNALPSAAYDTYALRQRPAPKSRRASCAEVDCAAHLHGWRTAIDPKAAQGPAQLLYLRNDRTRKHTETRDPSGLVTFTYEAGQTCFGQHWIEMQQLFLVRGGDHRGTTRPVRRHTRAEYWVEEFGENQDRLADRAARG